MASTGCRNRNNLAGRVMDNPADELSTARCGGDGQIVRPLIIEWPATDRASLESRLRRGVIVVRYEGCSVEVLRECKPPESAYDYLGITRKNDELSIRTADELYVNMPLTAVKLEAKLAKAGELNVSMALVGNYEAQRSRFDISELEGRCSGATHVIAAAQVGAFEFFAGAAAEVGAGVEVENAVGVGGRSSAEREVLNQDGDAEACEASTPSDTSPPAECGALLRLELSALDGITATCPPGSIWNGSACVSQERATAEAAAVRDQEKAAAVAVRDQEKAAAKSENEVIARQLCEIQMQCDSESSGMLPPEGKGYERQIGACVAMTKIMINDYTRPQARKCIAEAPTLGCTAFDTCVMGPELDDEDAPAMDDAFADDAFADDAFADDGFDDEF